jgi:hypothetical protein
MTATPDNPIGNGVDRTALFATIDAVTGGRRTRQAPVCGSPTGVLNAPREATIGSRDASQPTHDPRQLDGALEAAEGVAALRRCWARL